MSFISWEEYRSISAGVSEEEFARLSRKAEIKLNEVTHMRAGRFLSEYDGEQATDFQKQVYSQIQATMCELMDALYTRETSGMGTGIAGSATTVIQRRIISGPRRRWRHRSSA